MKLLIILTIFLFVIAAYQLLRVVELLRELKQTQDWKPTDKDNDTVGKLMLAFVILFFGAFYWQIHKWMDKALPASASEHGVHIDNLMFWNLVLVTTIFLLVNTVLFFFAFKYRGSTSRKAFFYAHNNKLELLWTTVPAITLAIIISFGLKYWTEITAPSKEKDPIIVELYAKQFDWTARFPGNDGKLGATDFRHTGGTNAVGLDTTDKFGFDDLLVKNELHLPVGKEVVFYFRSRDVIHSALMPHFRAQMNCVPGMVTAFKFKPIKTTAQMRQDPYVQNLMKGINDKRKIDGKEPVEFDYLVLCNKVCGASHFNMQMKIVVESESDYKAWLSKQKAFKTLASK